MTAPRVLVTRPEPEASDWARQLGQRGLRAEALPLIDIAAPRAGLQQLAQTRWRALMFVSGNAVQHFASTPGAHDCLRHARCWAPGPGTARALLAAGVPAERIDTPAPEAGQFDSEHLWPLVQAQIQPGDAVLIVRGVDAPADPAAALPPEQAGRGSGREWLSQRITEAGGQVRHHVAYERRPPAPGGALRQRALAAASDGTVWLFSSSEAVRNLQSCLPEARWHNARALVTHPRIAEAAVQAGFGQVHATRPTLEDVAASIESLA